MARQQISIALDDSLRKKIDEWRKEQPAFKKPSRSEVINQAVYEFLIAQGKIVRVTADYVSIANSIK